MAHSPTEAEVEGELDDYETGWRATFRLLREGMSWSGREANCVYLNMDGARFSDVSGLSGANFKDDGRGLALCDWDFDGAVDFWSKNRSAPQVRLMRNRLAGENGFVSLRLRGTRSNRDGIGARVQVETSEGERLIRTLHAGEGYLSQSTKWLHFGLGRGREVARVLVRWPGGPEEAFRGASAGGHFLLEEGSGEARPWKPPGNGSALRGEEVVVEPPTERIRIALAERMPMPPLSYTALDGAEARVSGGGEGRSLLLNLWASTCVPCLAEMKDLTARRADLAAKKIDVLALSVDLPEDEGDARAMLERVDWPFEAGFATPELLDTLDLLQRSTLVRRRRLPLPSSFLVTPAGEISVIYKGPLEVDRLLADADLADATSEELRYAASPLEGKWIVTEYGGLGVTVRLMRDLRDHGLLEGAAAVFATLDVPEDDGSRRKYVELAVELLKELEAAGEDRSTALVYGLLSAAEPDGIRWRQAHGETLERLGRDEEAEAVYRATLERKPNHATTLIRLSVLLLRTDRPEAALPFLERAVRARGDHWRANFLLGSTLVKLGREDEARGPLERVLKARPDHEEAKGLLRRIGG